MFSYCLNNPVNFMDSSGHDAIWIQESDNAEGFGHAGLLVEDEETKKWHYFYWGPVDENTNPHSLILFGVPCRCVYTQVDVEGYDLQTVEGIRNVLQASDNEFISERYSLVTDTLYLEGDYSNTHRYLSKLTERNARKPYNYNLIANNCVQNTWTALSQSNRLFDRQNCSVIPDIAYAYALGANSGLLKSWDFAVREICKLFD